MVYTSTLTLYRKIRDEIKAVYGQEADMLAMFIVEDVSGFSSTDILTDHKFVTGPNFRATIRKYILQLKKQEPIQYILGKAFFYERIYKVNHSTLIPRPETEELVKLVLECLNAKESQNVLDIGTGSGCIAISLALNSPASKVVALEESKSALNIAQLNADRLKAPIKFIHANIFSYQGNDKYDVIVSNPPYVRESEKKKMNKNVLMYEPAKALFVPDNDPLIFYERIAEFSRKVLNKRGGLFFEINEGLALKVTQTMQNYGFQKVKITKDLNGKDRFVHGIII